MDERREIFYEFGSFTVDTGRRRLLRGGEYVQLSPKVLDTLLVLIDKRGRIVTKDELLKQIWGGTIVEEGGLARNISVLRKVLGERLGEHQYIVTIPGKGYEFVAQVRETYESGTAVDMPAATVSESSTEPTKASWSRWRTAVGVTVLLLAAFVYLLTERHTSARQPVINSLAVLPLENLSGDPEQQYFADGMTEALINNLALIRALKVSSRTSVMAFKGTQKTPSEIARDLTVDAIVEGAVRRENGRVKIMVQLIYAPMAAHLWVGDYERDLTHVLDLQAELARTIADKIRIQVTPEEQERLRAVAPVNVEAHDEYLIGRYLFWKFIPADQQLAINHLQRAVQIDPNYALAWAGLSHAWWEFGIQNGRPRKETERPAREAADKALALDDRLAEAHVAQGFLKLLCDRDWNGAENSIRRAIELEPNNLDAHFFYGRLLMFRGNLPEAITESQIAERLDPVSPEVQSDLGVILYRAGKLDDAVTHFMRAIEREPEGPQPKGRLAEVYAMMGRYNDALALYDEARVLRKNPPNNPPFLNLVAEVYALMGKGEEAKQMLERLGDRASARAYAVLGDNDNAFRLLFKKLDSVNEYTVVDSLMVKTDPMLARLHYDPRWPDLLRRFDFPED